MAHLEQLGPAANFISLEKTGECARRRERGENERLERPVIRNGESGRAKGMNTWMVSDKNFSYLFAFGGQSENAQSEGIRRDILIWSIIEGGGIRRRSIESIDFGLFSSGIILLVALLVAVVVIR